MAAILYGLVYYDRLSCAQTLSTDLEGRPSVVIKYSLRGDYVLVLRNIPGAAGIIESFLMEPNSPYIRPSCPNRVDVEYRSTLFVTARRGEITSIHQYDWPSRQLGHFRVLC